MNKLKLSLRMEKLSEPWFVFNQYHAFLQTRQTYTRKLFASSFIKNIAPALL